MNCASAPPADVPEPGRQATAAIRVDGTDVSGPIRTREVSNAVSAVASIPEVRRRLVAMQQEIIAGAVGKENTYGTVVGRVAASPFTYLRVSTDDFSGKVRAYVGEGELGAWFGGPPTVYVVYEDTKQGGAVEVERVIPRDAADG